MAGKSACGARVSAHDSIRISKNTFLRFQNSLGDGFEKKREIEMEFMDNSCVMLRSLQVHSVHIVRTGSLKL